MAVHVFFCFPETAGKPLEEIDEIFATNTAAWKTRVEFAAGRELEKGQRSNKSQSN